MLMAGCDGIQDIEQKEECLEQKEDLIDAAFAQQRKEANQRNRRAPAIYNNGSSGAVLSAVYQAQPDLIAAILLQRSSVDFSFFKAGEPLNLEAAAQRIRGAEILLQSQDNASETLRRMASAISTSLSLPFGWQEGRLGAGPFDDFFPQEERTSDKTEIRNWAYHTAMLRGDFLLVDDQYLLLSAPSVSESLLNHAQQGSLQGPGSAVRIRLRAEAPGLRSAFERLWTFPELTASLEETYHTAPNDLLAALTLARSSCSHSDTASRFIDHSSCQTTMLAQHLDRKKRIELAAAHVTAAAHQALKENTGNDKAGAGWQTPVENRLSNTAKASAPGPQPVASPNKDEKRETARKKFEEYRRQFFSAELQRKNRMENISRKPLDVEIDSEAKMYFLENTPFERPPAGQTPQEMLYGAKNGKEGEFGRYIHNVLLAALRNTCTSSAAGGAQEVVFHTGRFTPPSNVLLQLAAMLDGRMPCQNVRITILANSPESAKFTPSSFAQRYAVKALLDYAAARHNTARSARLRYFEYLAQPVGQTSGASLLSSVFILGEDMMFSSADMSVRSYMMDTAHAVFIRNAPLLRHQYLQWVHQITSDALAAKELTESLASVPLDKFLEESVQDAQKAAAIIEPGRKQDLQARHEHIEQIAQLFRHVHGLAHDVLKRSWFSSAARDYNNLFRQL